MRGGRCCCGSFALWSETGESCTVQADGLCISTSFGDFPILPYVSTTENGYYCAVTIPKALPGGGTLQPIHKAGEPPGGLTGTFMYVLVLARPYVGGGYVLSTPMYRAGVFGGTLDEGCIVAPGANFPYIGRSVTCANDLGYLAGVYTWLSTTSCDPLAINLSVTVPYAHVFSWTIKNV